jgi:cytidylate kinase
MKNEQAVSFVVAIDGPAGAGKSTTARRVAERLGASYLDTGALYRCLALQAVENGIALDDARRLAELARSLDVGFGAGSETTVRLGARDVTAAIRTPEVSQAASRVSALPEVRGALVDLQRRAARAPGTVAEGRDMGTVIFPNAQLKVFLDADIDERARRRAEDLGGAGRPGAIDEVRSQISERDARDAGRAVAPLKPAADAVVIDTTGLGIEGVVERIIAEARSRGIGK